jgi:cytochrome c biogenesis protein CcdA
MPSWRKHLYSIRRCAHAVLLLLLLALAVTAELEAHADGVVHFFYFHDSSCLVCEQVHREVLEPLLAEYGDRLAVDERNISNSDDFQFLLGLEEAYQVESPSIPEVFIGEDALIGPEEVRQGLRERIEHYLAQGGVAFPAVPAPGTAPVATASPECKECDKIHQAQQTAVAAKRTPSPQPASSATETPGPAIYAAFFYQSGCTECDRAERDLQYILEKYPQLQVQRFNVREEAALNQYLSERAGVPVEKHLTAPGFFVGDDYLLAEEIRAPAIEALLQPYLKTGAAEPWTDWERYQASAEQSIVQRFRSLGIWTVVGAGLLDGVNPCAFATMIFLISYLSVRKRKGRELLATGVAFTIGVFFAYLAVGLGLLRFLTALPILTTVGKWVYGLTLLLCLALAWGSMADYQKARKGRLEDMGLKLPQRLRNLIRQLIREGSRARNYVLASLALGFAVSVVELACTGQVYLPTIIFVLGLPEWRARAALALLAYNVMFIVPLIVIFLMVYYGTTSKELIDWMNRHAAAVKLGTGMLFLLMAGWMGYSLFST